MKLARARGDRPLDPQVIGSVQPGPQVFARGDTGQCAELIGQMRLVNVAVLSGRGGPVDLALPVEVANHPLHPLHHGEPLGRETHLGREPPPQGPRQQPEFIRYLAHPTPQGQRPGGSDHGRVGRECTGQLLEQRRFHHAKSIRGRPGLEQPFAQATAGSSPEDLKRHQLVSGQLQGQRRPQEETSGTQRERHGNMRMPLLEFDHRGAARRSCEHRARHSADFAAVVEGAERVPVEVDPQARSRAGHDLLDRRLRLLARPVDDRLHEPGQRRRGPTNEDRHELHPPARYGRPKPKPKPKREPVSLFAKTPPALSWQDRKRPDKRWSQP
jgi:hypothetical protein